MTLLLENIRLALFSLKANKMRALLTMLGIIIGISSVIAIMTVGDSLTSTLTDTMAGLGANNIDVFLNTTEEYDSSKMTITEDDLFNKDMITDMVETLNDSIEAVSLTNDVGIGLARDGNLKANVSITGVSLGYFLVNNTELTAGRFFSTHETSESRKVCIVSDKLVTKMFEGSFDKALGQTVSCEVNGRPYEFTVVGIYKYEDVYSGLGLSSGDNVQTGLYIPYTTAVSLTHNSKISHFSVMTKAGVEPDTFIEDVKNFYSRYFSSNRKVFVDAYSMASMVDQMSSLMNKLTLGISVIAGIALLVGGIGVMNIMLVSITERTREIGTRKALGAPNSSIRIQFIVESIVICLIGGIIGIILGCCLGMLLAKLMECAVSPSIRGIILSITFSMAIGIFFGYYPANKAAKMDPIEALRYE